jgi:Tol biopolymer transport system component
VPLSDPLFNQTDLDPAWSPDATKIIFVRDGVLWVMDADGGNEVELGAAPIFGEGPAWSPDGNTIAYARDDSATNIYTRATAATRRAPSPTSPSPGAREP